MANTSKEKRYFLPKEFDADHFVDFLFKEKTVTLQGIGTFEIVEQKSYEGFVPSLGVRRVFKSYCRIKFRPTRQIKLYLKNGKN